MKKQFGACTFYKLSPPKNVTDKATNLFIEFEEALKLRSALELSLRKIKSLDRGKGNKGKYLGVKICIHHDSKKPKRRIRVFICKIV